MTTTELKDRLVMDPSFAFQYIYANNPDQVILNLRALGFLISNDDDVFNAVNTLLEQGADDKLVTAFSVPMLTDEIDPAEQTVVREAVTALDLSAPLAGKPRAAMKKTEGGGSSTDWGSIFSGLAAAAVTYMAARNQSKVNPSNGTPGAPPPPASKTNTTAIIAASVGGLLLVIVLILALRKK